MPTYSYKCTNCGNAFDIVQSFSDDALTTCDVCNGALRKVFSPVGVTFNGSGFYRTDSRGSGKSESTTKSDSAASSGSSGKSDSGSGSSTSSSSTTTSSTTSGSSTSRAAKTGAGA